MQSRTNTGAENGRSFDPADSSCLGSDCVSVRTECLRRPTRSRETPDWHSPNRRRYLPTNDTLAVYIDGAEIIYLIEGWTGRTPADLSVLVHEMVHHFQYKLGLKHECPQDREKLAYAAQDRWLHLFGHSLESDFELDGFSVLVKTHCLH